MEWTKEVVSCSNTGLIQIIPLIFLQEGNKKAPYVQPEESPRLLLSVHLGQFTREPSLGGNSRARHHCDRTDLTTGLTLQSKNGISLGQQRQKQGCDLASLYLKELWDKTKDMDKGVGRDWIPFSLAVISLCHYQWYMQRRTVTAWQCSPLTYTV